jgi:cysteine synthase
MHLFQILLLAAVPELFFYQQQANKSDNNSFHYHYSIATLCSTCIVALSSIFGAKGTVATIGSFTMKAKRSINTLNKKPQKNLYFGFHIGSLNEN